jgi:hypothetical protein
MRSRAVWFRPRASLVVARFTSPAMAAASLVIWLAASRCRRGMGDGGMRGVAEVCVTVASCRSGLCSYGARAEGDFIPIHTFRR